MAEPGRPQSGLDRLRPAVARIDRRQGARRHAPLAAAHEVGQRRHLHVEMAQARRNRVDVAETLAGPQRRRLHAFEAQAGRFGAE